MAAVRHRVRVVKEEDLKSSAFARVGSSPTDVAFMRSLGYSGLREPFAGVTGKFLTDILQDETHT